MVTFLTAALLAGAAATAIALAPTAAADRGFSDGPTPGDAQSANPGNKYSPGGRGIAGAGKNPLSSDFNSGLPTGWTNEALWARPGAGNPFGSGPKPPVLAMD